MTSLETPKLSTYHKGDLFEQKVFEYLSRELEAGNLFFAPQFATIQRKPKYFSREREDYIVFDISIEVTLPGFDTPSMIMLVECKNYGSTIPINDVEEFSSKIGQVTGHNAKGMFVTASAFQASALNFARNKGMAVVRHLDEGNFTWELSRSLLMGAVSASERRSTEILNALIAPSFQPAIYTTYAATPQGYTNSLAGVFHNLFSELGKDTAGYQQLIQRQPATRQRVAFLSLQQIEQRATEVLQRTGYTSGHVDLEKIIDHERTSSGLEVIFSGPSRSALGGISFAPPEIQIFTDNKDAPLARFTLAHESGVAGQCICFVPVDANHEAARTARVTRSDLQHPKPRTRSPLPRPPAWELPKLPTGFRQSEPSLPRVKNSHSSSLEPFGAIG